MNLLVGIILLLLLFAWFASLVTENARVATLDRESEAGVQKQQIE